MPTPPHAAHFRFYGALNDFLQPVHRQRDRRYRFHGTPAVKAAIEALGVPYAEVYFLLMNGEPAGFGKQLRDGDRVSVYPQMDPIEPEAGTLRADLPKAPRFVLDAHLGQLARYLRMLGFDARYQNDVGDAELARIADEEDRILLTRDRDLLRRSRIEHGAFVRATDPEDQLVETLDRFSVRAAATPMTRCLKCNGRVRPVPKADVLDEISDGTRNHFDEFFRCTRCEQVYWKGSHYERMQDFIADHLSDDSPRSA